MNIIIVVGYLGRVLSFAACPLSLCGVRGLHNFGSEEETGLRCVLSFPVCRSLYSGFPLKGEQVEGFPFRGNWRVAPEGCSAKGT